MSESYLDDYTLDEIAENDLEMVKDAIKNANRYAFHSPEAASRFMGQCVQSTLDRCGVIIKPGMKPKMVDRLLAVKKVRVENRDKYKGEDAWRCGLYIYKADELVAFVSHVLMKRPSVMSIRLDKEYCVITNARIK